MLRTLRSPFYLTLCHAMFERHEFILLSAIPVTAQSEYQGRTVSERGEVLDFHLTV